MVAVYSGILSLLTFILASYAFYYFLRTIILVSEKLYKVYIFFAVVNAIIIFLGFSNSLIYFGFISAPGYVELEDQVILTLRNMSLFLAALSYLIAFHELHSICLEAYERKNKRMQKNIKLKESLKKEIYERIKKRLSSVD